MKEFFQAMGDAFLDGECLILAAVIADSGSVPRPSGALMLAGRKGRRWGSTGGGIAEHLGLREGETLLREGRSACRDYVLHPNEAAELGAKCGGEITVCFQYLDGGDAGLRDLAETGLRCAAAGKTAWLIMELPSPGGERGALGIAGREGILAAAGNVPGRGSGAFPASLLTTRPALVELEGRRWFSRPLYPPGLVYVFGGGHVAQELVSLLARLDFRCVVFEDRQEFAGRELFPGAVDIILGNFERIGDSVSLEKDDYVVILTRGHQYDFDAERFALQRTPRYIGVIGSASKHAFVRDRLLAAGFGEEDLDDPRVHAPIGVNIGSKTPAEIAVSIAAELIRERSGQER
ncbi:MAG: XdhC family protein [Treponema sp.]|jgi:xanthine dehydrogenase accessory factor|nr:XdhC family protein [Treponema sp.]